ncbi:MAG: hypothetical protein BLM47_09540 [Candidatus Reconcilbacillus cellulovorans]|uniref:Prenylated flavin chaperone LpdD-like domain-containing protein n=1 Tax=Candidatus Reconcilbacillus cellulovorans TaxID=1906605 RepID=A0A2A6DYS6_9BACL|nr:MAG: hypothetical protein BLM47_09540 [Candidatus Reconcilbacillus cellulovorans]
MIRVRRMRMGDDRVYLVVGGDAHIGAVATAYWDGAAVKVKKTVLPGHREGPLAEMFAERVARRFRCTVTVMMGIHVDGASRDDIRRIEEEVVRRIERVCGREDVRRWVPFMT